MNKTIYAIFMMMLICLASASALVKFDGLGTPYIIYGKVTYDGKGVGGAELTLKNENTLATKEIVTSADGYWQIEGMNLLTTSRYRPPVQGDDTITVTYNGQSKSFKVFEDGNLGGYEVSFEALEAPPEPEPEPEPTDVTKVTSNEDKSVALIEAYYGDCIDVIIQDNKLAKLIDEEIDFEGDDYNVHEEILLKGSILTSLDNEDYGLIPYLIIPEEGITYRYVFDDAIPKIEVNDDDPLEITLLGEDIEIVDITNDKITILYGEEIDLNEGETAKGVTVNIIHDDYVSVTVGGESAKIYEGEVDEVGGIEIQVIDVIVDDDVKDIVTLRVAEDVKLDIKDGDDYNELEEWKWVITSNSIGITNQNEYEDLEEDYLPLKEGDSITLPNDYAIIKLHSISTPEVTELDIRVKDSYLKIEGSRDDSFADKYDLIYVDNVGIYDEDKVLISTDKVRIGESDIYLELSGDIIKIGDLSINLDMSDITYDGESYIVEDGNFLTYDGIIFKDAENAIEDKRDFEVIVPDERPEVTITVGAEVPEEEEEEEDVEPTPEPIPPPTPKPEVITKIICGDGKEVDSVEKCIVPPKPEEGIFLNLVSLLAIILGALGLGWRAGYLGLCKYYWNKGEKARALKMLFTATKRAKEDYYAKKK